MPHPSASLAPTASLKPLKSFVSCSHTGQAHTFLPISPTTAVQAWTQIQSWELLKLLIRKRAAVMMQLSSLAPRKPSLTTRLLRIPSEAYTLSTQASLLALPLLLAATLKMYIRQGTLGTWLLLLLQSSCMMQFTNGTKSVLLPSPP